MALGDRLGYAGGGVEKIGMRHERFEKPRQT